MGKAISSWSGGKDSCLAYYKAIKKDYRIERLLNFASKEHDRCCFHGVCKNLLRLQADRIGIELVQKSVSADMKLYEEEFKEAVSGIIKDEGIGQMVFGDIYLLDHVNWVKRVCQDIGIEPIEPLWNLPARSIVEEFIDLGFKAIIVSCKADILGEDFIGRVLERGLIDKMVAKGACPCGENGEYHTLVVDGPIFSKPIEIVRSQTILRNGFWKHWFLDIEEYR